MQEINFRYSENLDRAILVTSPMPIKGIENKSVFLAGTIDEGNSIDWQTSLISQIADLDVTILNPRRKIWDNFCDIDSAYFKEQVYWELDALEQATYIFMYFAANSYSPISLLELGLYANSGKVILVCPTGYRKKGNVDIVAKKYGVLLFDDMSLGVKFLRKLILKSK